MVTGEKKKGIWENGKRIRWVSDEENETAKN